MHIASSVFFLLINTTMSFIYCIRSKIKIKSLFWQMTSIATYAWGAISHWKIQILLWNLVWVFLTLAYLLYIPIFWMPWTISLLERISFFAFWGVKNKILKVRDCHVVDNSISFLFSFSFAFCVYPITSTMHQTRDYHGCPNPKPNPAKTHENQAQTQTRPIQVHYIDTHAHWGPFR